MYRSSVLRRLLRRVVVAASRGGPDRNFKRNSASRQRQRDQQISISVWGPFGYRGDLGVTLPRAQPPLLRERQQMSVAAARVSLIHSCSLSAALRRPLTRRAPVRKLRTSAAMAEKSVSSYLPSDTYNSLPKDGDLTFLHTMLRVNDLDATMDFFKALGLQETRRKESEKGKFTLVFLHGECPRSSRDRAHLQLGRRGLRGPEPQHGPPGVRHGRHLRAV